MLNDQSVPVVVGTAAQMMELDTYLVIYDVNFNPALVIGGGRVGRAAAAALKRRGLPVHIVEKDASLERRLAAVADKVFIGDAADRVVLEEAGLGPAPSVLLSTNDDATNIYLAVYCRRLDPDVRIVSRITHERNLESIHRAGADLVLSYASMAVESITAVLQNRELVLLGQGIEFYTLPVSGALAGKTLAESGVGARTGLNVIGIDDGDGRSKATRTRSEGWKPGSTSSRSAPARRGRASRGSSGETCRLVEGRSDQSRRAPANYAAALKSPHLRIERALERGPRGAALDVGGEAPSLVTMSVCFRMRSTVDIIRSPAVKRSPSR